MLIQTYLLFLWKVRIIIIVSTICLTVGAHPDKLQHGGQKPTETSVTEFCYKSVNLLLEELMNSKVILFLILELFR